MNNILKTIITIAIILVAVWLFFKVTKYLAIIVIVGLVAYYIYKALKK
jgi:hypothetical protein